jgi:SAM-dependent methyltransferase
MDPLPEDREAGEDYAGFDLNTYRKFMAAFRMPQYERDISFIRKYASGGRLLDVGCGTGEFLDVAGRNGFQAFGLEPSRKAFDIARKGRNVVRGELRNVEFKEEFFDAVTLWSVLEHIPAPSPFLGRTRAILKKGGILALRIPDAKGLLPSLALGLYKISLGRIASPLSVLYQLDWHYKHFYGYDRRTAGRLLDANGFEVIDLRSENGFDYRSLDLRLEYISGSRFARKAVRGALGAVLILAKLLRKEDELVLIARKS